MTESKPGGGKADKGLLEQFLGLFADVRRGEAGGALMMTLGIFFLLAAYYVLKPVRDSLITGLENGPKYKSYMGAAIAIALLFAVPAYGRFASSVKRNRLLAGVGIFFVANLIVFWGISYLPVTKSGMGQLGFALGFFLWVGVFNMMIVAQFWALANDIYTEEQGKRLFALIAIGQSVGSAVGSSTVSGFARTLGTSAMFLIGATLLGVSTLITLYVSSRGEAAAKIEAKQEEKASEPKKDTPPVKEGGPFDLVLKHRYLTLIAFFTLIFTLVNTNGEYVKDELIPMLAKERGAAESLDEKGIDNLRTQLFGSFYNYVNIAGVIIQSFLVSRIVKYFGFKRAFFIMPAIALGNALLLAAMPIWNVVRFGKIAENATDYSLNNTLRNMLWLPTTRRMKYLAKQAIDTFFVRAGDVTSAVLVFVLAQTLGLGVRTFGFVNIGLIAVWLVLAIAIIRENEKMAQQPKT